MQNRYRVLYAVRPSYDAKDVKLSTLHETHKYVKSVYATCLDEVYGRMQGEVWSPNGEARELILSLGLNHTSMSIGDVILDNENEYYVVDKFGYSLLT